MKNKSEFGKCCSTLINETKRNNVFWKQVGENFIPFYFMDMNFQRLFITTYYSVIGVENRIPSPNDYFVVCSDDSLILHGESYSISVPEGLRVAIEVQIRNPCFGRDLVLELLKMEDCTKKDILNWEQKGPSIQNNYFLPDLEGFSIISGMIAVQDIPIIECPLFLLTALKQQMNRRRKQENENLILKASNLIENYIKEKSK
jgi:hypothetical protein